MSDERLRELERAYWLDPTAVTVAAYVRALRRAHPDQPYEEGDKHAFNVAFHESLSPVEHGWQARRMAHNGGDVRPNGKFLAGMRVQKFRKPRGSSAASRAYLDSALGGTFPMRLQDFFKALDHVRLRWLVGWWRFKLAHDYYSVVFLGPPDADP